MSGNIVNLFLWLNKTKNAEKEKGKKNFCGNNQTAKGKKKIVGKNWFKKIFVSTFFFFCDIEIAFFKM